MLRKGKAGCPPAPHLLCRKAVTSLSHSSPCLLHLNILTLHSPSSPLLSPPLPPQSGLYSTPAQCSVSSPPNASSPFGRSAGAVCSSSLEWPVVLPLHSPAHVLYGGAMWAYSNTQHTHIEEAFKETYRYTLPREDANVQSCTTSTVQTAALPHFASSLVNYTPPVCWPFVTYACCHTMENGQWMGGLWSMRLYILHLLHSPLVKFHLLSNTQLGINTYLIARHFDSKVHVNCSLVSS